MNTTTWILFGLIWLALGIWTAVDAGSRPDHAWQRSGQSKVLWIVLPIVVSLLCGILGLIPILIYHLSIKKQVVAAETGGAL